MIYSTSPATYPWFPFTYTTINWWMSRRQEDTIRSVDCKNRPRFPVFSCHREFSSPCQRLFSFKDPQCPSLWELHPLSLRIFSRWNFWTQTYCQKFSRECVHMTCVAWPNVRTTPDSERHSSGELQLSLAALLSMPQIPMNKCDTLNLKILEEPKWG